VKKTQLLNSKKAKTKPTSFRGITYSKSKDRSHNDPKIKAKLKGLKIRFFLLMIVLLVFIMIVFVMNPIPLLSLVFHKKISVMLDLLIYMSYIWADNSFLDKCERTHMF